ncbi:uncharacterized protein K460DRAFT_96833 [Cucurbitaria berberidis CBS 394.84]|uniref:Uncharacterized protein n=1 Tax=Cucurbitaria berberidis CBS 394.84 TaxID=1168544 RepID=A0A9P4GES9_9PLEO|nr:uncharacterized protein K460DRAFT_96833 [Cucurbitaria berberidis CBS 394.84]KAF1844698.1 hypothetical protein K460DRAFT_96833 [Cucurbitaria berberidis CBS 394.84]
MSATIPSLNPFSDENIEPTMSGEKNFADFKVGNDATLVKDPYKKTASRLDNVAVPILDAVQAFPTWSPQSSVSTLSIVSTAPTSPTTDTFNAPIQWNNADLMYLLSCTMPDELLANQLIFSPPLEDLRTITCLIHLQLFRRTPTTPPPPEAFSKHAPIGTGRPCSSVLVAESDKKCGSTTEARRSLAKKLLSSMRVVGGAVDMYNVLVTLHRLSTPTLYSIYRSLILMTAVSDREWSERLQQLRGLVDGCDAVESVDFTCTVEARLEVFFLEVGVGQLERWIRSVGVALALGRRGRKVWADVYGDAAAFLGRAMWELLD